MKRHKRYSILVIGLALLLASFLVACAKEPEAPYAPDFTLETLSGERVTLSDFIGKPIMLTFWTINCPACAFQMPFVQAFYDEGASEEVTLLTVNVGDRAALVQDFVTSYEVTFPVLLDSQGRVAQAYGIPGVPVNFFIDVEGIVRAYKIGPFQSEEEIESVLDSL